MNNINFSTKKNSCETNQKELILISDVKIVNNVTLTYFALKFKDLNYFDMKTFYQKWSIPKNKYYKAIEKLAKISLMATVTGNAFANNLQGEEV